MRHHQNQIIQIKVNLFYFIKICSLNLYCIFKNFSDIARYETSELHIFVMVFY